MVLCNLSYQQYRLAPFYVLLAAFSVFLLVRKSSQQTAVDVSKALQSFIIPTRSHWPKHILRATASARHGSICLPLDLLLSDIYDGNLELRSDDLLEQLLSKGVVILSNGWSLRYTVGNTLTARILLWKICFPMKGFFDRSDSKELTLSAYMHEKPETSNTIRILEGLTIFPDLIISQLCEREEWKPFPLSTYSRFRLLTPRRHSSVLS